MWLFPAIRKQPVYKPKPLVYKLINIPGGWDACNWIKPEQKHKNLISVFKWHDIWCLSLLCSLWSIVFVTGMLCFQLSLTIYTDIIRTWRTQKEWELRRPFLPTLPWASPSWWFTCPTLWPSGMGRHLSWKMSTPSGIYWLWVDVLCQMYSFYAYAFPFPTLGRLKKEGCCC